MLEYLPVKTITGAAMAGNLVLAAVDFQAVGSFIGIVGGSLGIWSYTVMRRNTRSLDKIVATQRKVIQKHRLDIEEKVVPPGRQKKTSTA